MMDRKDGACKASVRSVGGEKNYRTSLYDVDYRSRGAVPKRSTEEV